jgi:hypothetical protein
LSVTTISPPGIVASMGGLPLMRQLGLTVTVVFGFVPTTVTYDRSRMLKPPIFTGCPAYQPSTRYCSPSALVGKRSEASFE